MRFPSWEGPGVGWKREDVRTNTEGHRDDTERHSEIKQEKQNL
jgi:hypothetical protein